LRSRAFFLRCRSLFQRLIGREPRPIAETVTVEDHFEALVEEAIGSLPDDLREFMSNVAVVVEDEPPRGLPLLGLYQGVPLTRRTSGYAGVPPDRITIYQGPLERMTGGDPDRLRVQVRRVVLHEIAHHFGISDQRLIELDRY
jgi:predicted Zn-dependent protease with MMP-like domain